MNLILDLEDFSKRIVVEFTLTILGQGIVDVLNNDSWLYLNGPSCFQLHFSQQFKLCLYNKKFMDVSIIFSKFQKFYDDHGKEFIQPLSACFVVSYILSDPPFHYIRKLETNILREYSNLISYLACLSVKLGSKNRIMSYLSLHITMLLRKHQTLKNLISRYKYLITTCYQNYSKIYLAYDFNRSRSI